MPLLAPWPGIKQVMECAKISGLCELLAWCFFGVHSRVTLFTLITKAKQNSRTFRCLCEHRCDCIYIYNHIVWLRVRTHRVLQMCNVVGIKC